jgi:hypothetical protein
MTGPAAPHGTTSSATRHDQHLPLPLPVHPPRQMTHQKGECRP